MKIEMEPDGALFLTDSLTEEGMRWIAFGVEYQAVRESMNDL